MRPKGLREIKTAQGIPGRASGSSREQAVAELARLEHERARLQRELNVWRQNQQRTDDQLRRVEERLSTLQGVLAEEPDATPRPAPRRPAPRPATNDDDPNSSWSSVALEY